LPAARGWLNDSDLAGKLPPRLAVGWSGGADSTALLLALKQAGFDVQAWHVDHGWHDASARETSLLAERARAWDVPFVHASLSERPDTNREAQARQGRYRLFARFAAGQGVDALCLGHHLDDQAETVCMRMLQGGGVYGCRGMAPVRRMAGLTLYRPLLHLRRATLRQALVAAGVTWLEDASNADASLWRNHIRHHLFPAMQGAGSEPAALFLRWQRQAMRLADTIDAGLRDLHPEADEAGYSIPWSEWASLPLPMRMQAVQRLMATLFGEGHVLGRRHLELIERWRVHGGHGGLDLSRCRLSRRDGRLHLGASLATLR